LNWLGLSKSTVWPPLPYQHSPALPKKLWTGRGKRSTGSCRRYPGKAYCCVWDRHPSSDCRRRCYSMDASRRASKRVPERRSRQSGKRLRVAPSRGLDIRLPLRAPGVGGRRIILRANRRRRRDIRSVEIWRMSSRCSRQHAARLCCWSVVGWDGARWQIV